MRPRMVFLTLVLGCMAVIATACWEAPRLLAAGPDRIDLRPTPEAVDPKEVLPQRIADYERGACDSVTSFHGLALGPHAMEALYAGPQDTVRVIAARMATYRDAARAVRDLARQLQEYGLLDSHRLQAEEPYEGWWGASGKRNFAYWRAPAWNTDCNGFIWQSGQWCFIVASNSGAARTDVSKEFPY